jgi:hypothetical protein
MLMMMFVLDDTARLDDVLEAWAAVGVSGATFFESMGGYRRKAWRERAHMRYDYGHLDAAEVTGNCTLFAIVPNEQIVRQCLAATERIVGELDDPNTGVFMAWPLAVVKGVPPSIGAREAN